MRGKRARALRNVAEKAYPTDAKLRDEFYRKLKKRYRKQKKQTTNQRGGSL